MTPEGISTLREWTKSLIHTLLIGAMIMIGVIVLLDWIKVDSPVKAGLLVQVLNSFKEIYKGPSIDLFGMFQEQKAAGPSDQAPKL